MLDYVKRYVDLGFVVHPLCPPTHYCQSPGKIPFDPVAGRHMSKWQHHEQFSLQQWQEWLDYDSEINVGFLTGSPSGLVCLDIDDDEGMALIEELEIRCEDTWQYNTGRGLRVLFESPGHAPSGLISRGSASIEVLGDGRQSVLPPSVHPNGKQYHWVMGRSPKDGPCSGDVGWLRFLGSSGGDGLDGLNSDETDWASILGSAPQRGERNVKFTSIAGHLMSPGGGMSEGEAAFWLSLYNRTLPEPMAESELTSIVRSIRRSEERTVQSGEREIKRLMVQYGCSRSDARTMWEGMV